MSYSNASPVFLLNTSSASAGYSVLVASLLVVLFAAAGAGGGQAILFFVKAPANIGPPVNETFYARKVWKTDELPPHFVASDDLAAMQKYMLYFLWDVYPRLEQVKEAGNLALQWPPPRGTRYRLAAYPFVHTGNDIVPVAVAKSILKMVNKYEDQATPPAWYISVYDAEDWTRKNIFLPGQTDNTHMSCRCSSIFRPFKWIEVTRTCYPVSDNSYPLCDDGGQWYYHAPGSGVWYNLGRCLVRYNKFDAGVYCMALMGVVYAAYSQTQKDQTSFVSGVLPKDFPMTLLTLTEDLAKTYAAVYANLVKVPGVSLAEYKNFTKWQDFWSLAKAHFTKRVESFQGETSFVSALMKLIKDAKSTSAKDLNLDGFLPFQAFHVKEGRPRLGFLALFSVIGGVLGLLLAVLFLFVKGSLVVPLVLLAAVGAGLWFGWKAGLEAFVRTQGVYMLSEGLKLYNVTAADIVDICVEPVENGASASEKQQFFSGLPSSWIADMSIEIFASMLGFDTVVMHSQPNKGGSYLVEIVDVTKIKMDFGSSPAGGDPRWWAGGTCGEEPTTPSATTTDFSCQNCPYKDAQAKKIRGGLCLQDTTTSTSPTLNNYYTLQWKNHSGIAAEDAPLMSDPSSPSVEDLNNWLNKYAATKCDCREVKDAMCLGCMGFVSDHVCNWSTPSSSLSPA